VKQSKADKTGLCNLQIINILLEFENSC